MPIYEYACASCGREFEQLVRTSGPEPECPQCHGHELKRKLSTFAAISSDGGSAMAASPCASCGDPNGPCKFAQ